MDDDKKKWVGVDRVPVPSNEVPLDRFQIGEFASRYIANNPERSITIHLSQEDIDRITEAVTKAVTDVLVNILESAISGRD